jgi:hypothetical protein
MHGHEVLMSLTRANFLGHIPLRQSRVGAVALYTVLWTVVVKYRKWLFSAPRRTKTPQPIEAKI